MKKGQHETTTRDLTDDVNGGNDELESAVYYDSKRHPRSLSPPHRANLGSTLAFRNSISDEEDVDRVADVVVSTAVFDDEPHNTAVTAALGDGSSQRSSISTFLCDPVDEKWIQKIDLVLPNFRDIAVSSCCPQIKPRLLYRSARPFGDHHTIEEVFVKALQITTVIDLRDDNLLALREEYESRLHLSGIFLLLHASQRANKFNSDVRSFPFQNQRPSSREGTSTAALTTAYHMARTEELQSKGLPRTLARDLGMNPSNEPIYEFAMRTDSRRMLLVVNVFDAPAVKKRILEHATERANLPFLPVVAAAKAIDKLTGTNNLAPYYFCRFVVSTHELVTTYYEMVDNCGANFALALKLIALAHGPVLFHCTLGKDRTGMLAMLILHILGAPESAIIFDYSLTEQANAHYHSYSKRFIVEMSGLPQSFCGAGAEIMRMTIDFIKLKYGSIDSYLDFITFGPEWREFLREKYTDSNS